MRVFEGQEKGEKEKKGLDGILRKYTI